MLSHTPLSTPLSHSVDIATSQPGQGEDAIAITPDPYPKRPGYFAPRPQYSGPASDRTLERLTLRRYTRHRSLLVDRWVHYADSEGFATGGRQGLGGVSHV